VLGLGFLRYLQQWLQTEARLWRVAIPTDNTDENLILVYPEEIKINESAERDLTNFLISIRPRLAEVIAKGREQFNLPVRPHPPIPDNGY
jgi:hypothetical protein